MKASIKMHVDSLWANRAELIVEAELDNPSSAVSEEIVSTLFESAQLMAAEARSENERALFGQEAINSRYRELDQREARMDARDKRVTRREGRVRARGDLADDREEQADTREREQMEHDVHVERGDDA